MADLLTLVQAKAALKIEGTDYDDTLDGWIKAVSARIYRHLKLDPLDYEMSGGELDPDLIPPEAITAAEFLLAYYYDNLGADERSPARDLTHGEMPWQVQNILGGLRDPTLA